MITITKLNEREMIINCELIEFMEATPDTTISMTTGRKIIVRESLDEVMDKIIAFKRRINDYIINN